MSGSKRGIIIVKRCWSYYKVYSCLRNVIYRYWNHLNIDKLIESDKVIIKINLCNARRPETGAITHPLFLDGFLKVLRELIPSGKCNILVVESDASVAQPDLFIKWFGFKRIFEKWDVKYVNLSHCGAVKKFAKNYIIPVPKLLKDRNYFFVTMPKLKTNVLTYITCCLKNQYGCIPIVNKHKYHFIVDEVISFINKCIKPDLCIVDGVISMLGARGPACGRPERTGVLIVSNDPVATDSYVAKLLGLNPRRIAHIVKSFKEGIGSMNYLVLGDDVSDQFPKIKLIERAELHLLNFFERYLKRRLMRASP